MSPRKPAADANSPTEAPSVPGRRASGAGGEPPAPSLLFVDAIEGDKARLLWGVEAFDVPAGLLPPGTREGAWLHLTLSAAPAPPDEGGPLREELSRDDDGGDIKL